MSTIFTDFTLDGQPARISRVFKRTPPQRGLRVPPQPTFGFKLNRDARYDTFEFRTAEEAEAVRADLLATGHTPAPSDDQSEEAERIMRDCVEQAVATPQPDGRLFVRCDDGPTVVLNRKGMVVA